MLAELNSTHVTKARGAGPPSWKATASSAPPGVADAHAWARHRTASPLPGSPRVYGSPWATRAVPDLKLSSTALVSAPTSRPGDPVYCERPQERHAARHPHARCRITVRAWVLIPLHLRMLPSQHPGIYRWKLPPRHASRLPGLQCGSQERPGDLTSCPYSFYQKLCTTRRGLFLGPGSY